MAVGQEKDSIHRTSSNIAIVAVTASGDAHEKTNGRRDRSELYADRN